MRPAIHPLLCLVLALALPGAAAQAEQLQLAREHHVWARFRPGAWTKVRVTTETLDAQGRVASTSSTDTTTWLESVSANTYNLQIEISVEVAGKRFDAEPQFVSQGYLGEAAGQTSIVKPAGAATVAIEDQRIPCRVFTVETSGEDRRGVTKIYYADKVEPHLLRKESVTTNPSGTDTLYETDESVVAVDMPFKVLSEILPTSVTKTVRKNAKGTTITIAVQSPRVPGGVVAHTSKELDAEGRIVRRSTLELLDYGHDDEQQVPRRRFGRNRRR